jgi:hypothetical protein
MQETEGSAPAVPRGTDPTNGPSPGRIALITVVAVIILLVIISIGYGLATHPYLTSILRDISIIVLAFVTVIIGVFLMVLIFQLQSLTVVLRDEIKPILESANQTANTVRGTTTFLSDAVVSPMISAASYVSAVRATLRAVAPGSRGRGRRDPKQASPEDR